MQSLLQHWERNARGHEDFNWAFLCSLSNRLEKAVDRTARRLHREAFAIIDCTRCAHCCKTMIPIFFEDEAREVARHLGMKHEEFLASYLVASGDGERLKLRGTPCPFLRADNRCTIYEVRPTSCRAFPHTNRAGFAAWAQFHLENAIYCPAVFYVIEQMRARGVR